MGTAGLMLDTEAQRRSDILFGGLDAGYSVAKNNNQTACDRLFYLSCLGWARSCLMVNLAKAACWDWVNWSRAGVWSAVAWAKLAEATASAMSESLTFAGSLAGTKPTRGSEVLAIRDLAMR